MPITFYPEKPIELLEKYITKENGTPLNGEIEIYRKLYDDLNRSRSNWWVWHDLKLPFHSDRSNPYRKTSAQIDFLILSEEGILILEVKGGPISYRNNTFYYGNNYENKISQNPFSQAEGYKYTVRDNVLNSGSKYLICHAVAMPHCHVSFDFRIIENSILWSAAFTDRYGNSMENFILSVFKYNREKHKKYHRNFPKLGLREIDEVKRILSPVVYDLNRFYNADTSEWLNVSNLDILDSLSKNDRIMIEGCPGTGKTTLAKAFIDKQLTKKGLYLCWNNLLMHKIKFELKSRDILKTCEVNTLSKFILKLDQQLVPNQLMILDEEEYYRLLKELLAKLKNDGALPQYDYMVIDEGQDILDRGADLLINELLANGKGLENGKALLLYDIDQSYFIEGRDVAEIAALLSVYFAHFKLNEVRRSAQCPDIRKMAVRAINDPDSLSFELFSSHPLDRIKIKYFSSLEDIKNYIVKNILRSIRENKNSLKGSECIVLIESVLLKPSYGIEPGMHYYLQIKDVEELDQDNIGDTSNVLRYTSILKYKGLEKENVILIVRNPSLLNRYELYIGVTRAIANLEVLVVNTISVNE
ncbi:nuclease-related domain-containing DEAD/DEAH box helicase [Gaoshiqia sediminis]|uniref:NERD domain-containing protein n=1 Tax=Gaoshiqia sediminis TaxID=2986998 RepID=A0AA42C8W5_9BACT|nr:nuclease-related domain-containing protein [Gaoshiqia sediminis]MCW0481355.1 NERD domain-containing protein [Gaoshiqia sediminis]